ncbi:MAG: phosphate system positive regulatory protein pho81, partial [Trizodia sp. TS-e1964]
LIKQLSATPTLRAQNATATLVPQDAALVDTQTSLQANRATFFFRLERELEKVNAFYLQKEAELKLRLRTLLDKKKVIQSRSHATSKISASFITLEEGFQQFGSDLNKLQQFVEICATAFSKILKKWDKTSKSRTKELYLSRAVEVQPCFNRDVISELSDQATTSLLELGAWAEGEKVNFGVRAPYNTISGQPVGTDDNDIDSQFLDAITSGNIQSIREWISKLKGSIDGKERITRTFLAAIADAPEQSLDALLESDQVEIQSEDEINERNCLHEAAICGRAYVLNAGLERAVDATRADVYGRLPLHYACMHGRVDMLQALFIAGPVTINAMDHDNFTPLIHAIVHHQLSCVEQLLLYKARLDPTTESDHIPLNIACQHGSVAIAELLLKHGAKVLPDAEGLYPQHLVARAGRTPQILLMLRDYGADLDEIDKFNQWTPLFHAASEGHVKCLETLLGCGVKIDILDEKDLSAMYYAAWEGHMECMKLLSSLGGGAGLTRPPISPNSLVPPAHNREVGLAKLEPDGIPDLSLPPPIIPLRRYGHNFLDDKTFVQISFEEKGSEAICFYNDSKYPAARLTISSKLSELIPRNLQLPIQEDNRTTSFQTDSLDTFALDFDIFPTFGSKVIAKTAALSHLFRAINSSSGHCCLPLFDPRLRAIGQIGFDFQVIKPFHGVPLEITHFATYWKATSPFDSHPNSLITGSSLSGEFVRLYVQLTSDGVPVLFPRWKVNHGGIDFPIGRLSYDQYMIIGKQYQNRNDLLKELSKTVDYNFARVHKILAKSFVSLSDTLSNLPDEINVDLHILYPSHSEQRTLRIGGTPNLNESTDAILKVVFDHTRTSRERSPDITRSINFSSYNSTLCTALNWKQPNYPVFLCNNLGQGDRPKEVSSIESSGRSSLSVKEAVRIAQSNNFMGLICSSRLLSMVPALVESVKVAGLVIVSDTSNDHTQKQEGQPRLMPASQKSLDGIDGVLNEKGVLSFTETIEM